jgi:RimJ/RimL family protein N-acetyltransferase
MKDIFRGTLVRLSAISAEDMARAHARWNRDTEMHRLADSDPARLSSEKKLREYFEKELEKDPPAAYRFSIRTLADDSLIGGTGLVPDMVRGDAWFYIVIGDRNYWDKGYGTDATRLVLQYGFIELNLRRISLGLHAYNDRALKSYLKAGFTLEGRTRGDGLRDGVRFDGLWMGILREEWKEMNK